MNENIDFKNLALEAISDEELLSIDGGRDGDAAYLLGYGACVGIKIQMSILCPGAIMYIW